MRKIIYSIVFVFLSCNTDNLEFLDITKEGLTVEAYIEANKTPVVYLTTSLPLNGFKEIDFLKAIESTAKVEIFENNKNEIAVFSKDNSRYPSRYYGFEELKGKTGELYTLKITVGDKVYTSEASVPEKPIMSKITIVKQSALKKGTYNLKIDLMNPKVDSYFKFYIKKSKDDVYKKTSLFVVSNELINAPVLTIYNDFLGLDENDKTISLLENNESYDLRIVSISKSEFRFWDKILVSQTQIVNLPSTAKEVPTNISNDAFGFFSGNSEVFSLIRIEK
ncbi:hypothetical protein FHR24_000310 [Wenyingzhuangia heitensis]|uniref:DUF4249 domain-containing protein n=1 Tax=Wenyingzhuangia heitensis TaxID=1487859 RepID=A0ABX0U8N7_9FLAO|nr:DUF4249 family protein [Wenyingzhuangia heitensis]NIJ43871.1 hypothetical protein [Wenyingzhuangia heitensis]